MFITINLIETAEKLSDQALSFKTENQLKVDVGIDYTKEDLRNTLEWQQLYSYYVKILTSSADMPIVTKERAYKRAEFVKEYAEKHGISEGTVYKKIKFKSLKIK